MMSKKRVIVAGLVGIGVLFLGGMALASFTTIKQGHVGVVYNRSGGVESQTLSQGMHLVLPWTMVTQYPVALETVEYKDVQLATKDGKPLTMNMTFNYMNDPEQVVNIFNKFKGAKPEAIEQGFILSRIKEAALSVTSKYTILEIFQNREQIKVDISKVFTEDMKKQGFTVTDFVLGTPTPDESTAKAIQAVVDAHQQLEALKIEKQKAQEIAEKQKIEAEGKAQATIAEAKGQAESNRLVQQSITPELLKKMEMEARIAHGWVEVQGASAVVTNK
ncbi:prohibitin family protein [Brevibacillus laterosporus]|uniref:prohibitin family protein n=1 Tax=Brevibacillus laterosporus TaxID=1465 RepID=UPI00215D4795|nr:prohibitin family protein [Brevibacillus laterosporus]MCR8994719.1 prohibitin family protein [Brevibacillus laterosporus]